jgi:hypothetical protein
MEANKLENYKIIVQQVFDALVKQFPTASIKIEDWGIIVHSPNVNGLNILFQFIYCSCYCEATLTKNNGHEYNRAHNYFEHDVLKIKTYDELAKQVETFIAYSV